MTSARFRWASRSATFGPSASSLLPLRRGRGFRTLSVVLTASLVASFFAFTVSEPVEAAPVIDPVSGCEQLWNLPTSLLGTVSGSGSLGYVAAPVGATSGFQLSAGGAAGAAGGFSAASAAAVAAVALGGFCLGVSAPSWIWGNPFSDPPEYIGPVMQVNPGGTNCSVLGLPGGAPYAAGVPQCFQFATPGGYEYAGFRAYQADGPAPTSNHCNLVGPWKLLRLNSGWGACSNNTVPGIYNGAQAPITTLALDCRTATICSVRPHSADRFIAYEVYNYPNNVGGTYLLDHPSVNQGELLRWSQRVYCRNFVTGTLQTYYERGPWTYAAAFEGQQPPEAASMCPSGFGLTRVITYQDTLPDAYKSSSYLDDYPDLGDAPHNSSTIADWNVPSFWTTDPVARTCFGSAFSDCQITINTNNPVPEVNLTNVTTQQVTTITATNPATNVGTAVQTLQPEPQTTTTVVTNPTTTAVTTTTVPGPPTTVPPEVPPSEPPPPPGPPDDGFAFGTCMDEQTVGISVGWSPASWIPALVRYIAAPILCSLLWLIVPADGFAALFDDLSRSLTDSELVGPFIGAVTSLQLSQCAPVTLPAVGSITGRSVDVGLCGNVVINSVWAMFFALGLLGLGKEAIDTVTQFRRNQAARSVQAQG